MAFNDQFRNTLIQQNTSLLDGLRLNEQQLDAYGSKLRALAKDLREDGLSREQIIAKVQEEARRQEKKWLKEKEQAELKHQEDLRKREENRRKKDAEDRAAKFKSQLDAEKELADQRKKSAQELYVLEHGSAQEILEVLEARRKENQEQRNLLDQQERIAKEQNNSEELERVKEERKNLERKEAQQKKQEQILDKDGKLTAAKEKAQRKKDQETRSKAAENIISSDVITAEDKQTLKESNKENLKDWIKEGFSKSGIGEAISKGIANFAKAADSSFQEAEQVLNELQAKVSTRLEGSGRTYSDISQMLRKNLTLSPIIEQRKVLENVGRLVQEGIAYDIEQRAFLQTVSEEIKSTFDAFDANLLRIIRIQREDSSYARMGLETSLSRLFNEYFLDSSYMNNLYDEVSGALIDATSQLTTAQSAEFEYTVQKWLGALYSMGASNSFVSQVASGLNMLGTGNVQGLSGSPMQTLFAMAANRSGTDYATLLTGGLNAQNTNDLLKSMVEYLAEISGNTKTNKVVAGAYSNLFNMTLSDMRAVQNLRNDINSLYNENITYSQMGGITNQRLTTLGDNYTLGKRVQTLFSNLMFSSAQSLVENPVTYLLYKAANFVGSMGEPEISVAPWGMGMHFKVTDLIKDGMFGAAMLGNVGSAIAQLFSDTGNELMNWTTQGEMRGGGYNLSARSSTSSSYSMTGSGSDIETQNLQQGAAKTKETNKTLKGQEEDEEDIDISLLYYGLFDNTNKEGAVSAINRNIANINTLMTASYNTDLSAQRVVISGWDMAGQNGAEFELPVRFGTNGQLQFSNGINVLPTKEMILVVLTYLQGVLAENGSVNVNLLSSDVDIAAWAKGNAGSDNTETVRRESGSGNNGIVRALSGTRASDRTVRFAAIE